jgi:hypothetical protein
MPVFKFVHVKAPAAACILLFALLTTTHAQGPGQSVDRAQLLRNPPTFSADPTDDVVGPGSSHADASPNDPDLGEQAILKRQELYRAFTVSVAAPFFYTSNVALVRTGERDDFVFAPAAAIAYAPRITQTLYGNFSVGQQQFYYNRFGEFDFGSFDARAGLAYRLPKLHDLLLRAEYNFNRLTTSDDLGDDFFSNHSLFFSAELPFRIGRAQQVGIGAEANVSLAADPEPPRRHDFNVYAGYAVNHTRALTVSAVGRIAVRDYTQGDRVDVSEILALTATYHFTKWLSASATSTLATSDSNRSVYDYDVANLGAAVSAAYQF